ncbi:hypothetical protein BDP55DRAFT_110017 [Colletotrichum godetiae]|uniref:Uncharacterized protein n=1 Tax=Colletotrichum godetiae TaxID=1209918 RepID=A0AAJ0AQV1_9PEZI|nr:uncharacterized protein BDP55DRAFT_110017 [Colletotrichum godetiae]KAK1676156.1 hypothetical protein BDP55DRAFT_110017 [Colletotrichum godetiae]
MRQHLQPPWATSSPSALLLHMQMSPLVQATLDGGKIISASPICQPCRISYLHPPNHPGKFSQFEITLSSLPQDQGPSIAFSPHLPAFFSNDLPQVVKAAKSDTRD